MSIFDVIKKSVLEGFDTSLTGVDIVLGLTMAMAAALFILLIYQRTARQVTLNRSFCLSLLLISVISAMMVLTITSNLALSLGMVGALSIVRFRTAIKDSSDTAFLFWAVAAGITSGAGFYLLTILGCLFVGIACVAAILIFDNVTKPFLLVIRATEPKIGEAAEKLLAKHEIKFTLSSLVQNNSYTEVIYEMGLTAKKAALCADLKKIPGVTTVSLVDCRKS